eukprot:10837266-Ditylum_brightwellii.AAC.1
MVMIGPSLSATSARSKRSTSKKHAKKNISVEGIRKKEKCEASISSVANIITSTIEVDRNSIHVPMFIDLEVEEEQASPPMIEVCLDRGTKPSKHPSPKNME